MLGFGADDSGLFLKYLQRGCGYYIDIGACGLVAKGEIVAATGYASMNGWATQLIDQDVADRVGRCWVLGSDIPMDPGPWEGKLRNMWKPTQVPNLWFMGGNLHQARP